MPANVPTVAVAAAAGFTTICVASRRYGARIRQYNLLRDLGTFARALRLARARATSKRPKGTDTPCISNGLDIEDASVVQEVTERFHPKGKQVPAYLIDFDPAAPGLVRGNTMRECVVGN